MPKKNTEEHPKPSGGMEFVDLIDLCCRGELFAVQDWIAAGKPVDLPPSTEKHSRQQSPLEIAIELGFYSLVEVLLKAGADMKIGKWKGPMHRALDLRRLDLIRLLLESGYDIKSVPMKMVFDTWEPEIMEYFIDHGADVETDNPLAAALCDRIRTALRVLKRYNAQFPHFKKQANIALRYHCRRGDQKWVSLMLWAEANPYEAGSEDPRADDDEGDMCAMALAAAYQQFDLFKLKGMQLLPQHPAMHAVLRMSADSDEGILIAAKLLSAGMNPNDRENGGCSAIESFLDYVGWDFARYSNVYEASSKRLIDSDRSRRAIRAIHLLCKWGARWSPSEDDLKRARRALIKAISEYSMEFVWIMWKYKSSDKESVINLLRATGMKKHVRDFNDRIQKLLLEWA